MNLKRPASFSVVLGVLITGLGLPAQAVDDRCLDPGLVYLHQGAPSMEPPVVPTGYDVGSRGWNGGEWPIVVSDQGAHSQASLNVPEPVCPDTTLTFVTPNGSTRQLPLPYYLQETAPFAGYLGNITMSSAETGRWQLTGIRSGTASKKVEPPTPFWVLQKVVVLLDHLPSVPAGTTITVAGTVTAYSRDSVPVPYAGKEVDLMSTNFDGDDQATLGTAVTDSRGRFSLRMPVAKTRLIRATVPSQQPFGGDTDATVSYAGSGIQLLSAQQIPTLGGLNTVSGRTTPGYRSVVLESQIYGAASEYWTPLASTTSGSDGRFTLRFRPTDHTPQTMRLRSAGTAFESRYEATPAHRTSLTGTTGGTHTSVIRPGTKMSSFGRLKVTFNNGATGNYANQPIVVQTRVRGNPAAVFTTVATTRTTSTGYFYTNWTARQDVDVRVAFLSPYRTVQWAFTPQGFVDVR